MAKEQAPKRPQAGWMTKQDMVASCGITPTAFDKWGVEPVAKIGRHVYYRVADVLANRLAKQMMRIASESPRPDPSAASAVEAEYEKMLLTREQRIGQELKNAQTRRELAPVQVIEWTLSRVGSQISAHLEAIPQKLKKLHPSLPARAIEDVKREVVKAQNMAARVSVDLDEYYERDPEGD